MRNFWSQSLAMARRMRDDRLTSWRRGCGLRFALALSLGLTALSVGGGARAQQKAPFDLAGPALQVQVIRAGRAYPISRTPNLLEGDDLQIGADFSAGQGARYLLVVVFLRGATNPPPKSWFFGLKSWEHGGQSVLRVHVPQGAAQALILLAPHTNADFDTLRDAVRARPGAFVRASQDLNQLGHDRSRLYAYLAAIRETERDDPAKLQTVSTALALTLGIKIDQSCFDRSPDLQAACLMQGQDSLVLATGDTQDLVGRLASGATADLMTQLGYVPQMGAGAYSPYVGAVLDIARLLDSLGVAKFQYIPALAAPDGARLQLRLNTAPSFGAVKSVLVAALPPVGEAAPPPLRASDPDGAACLEAPDSVLKVEGAPLVFSTGFATDLKLRLKSLGGESFDVPVQPDAERGGLVADTASLTPGDFPPELRATLVGVWGTLPFTGPSFRFQNAGQDHWRVLDEDRTELVSGRNGRIRLTGGESGCVRAVSLEAASLPPRSLVFHSVAPTTISVETPLKDLPPGEATLDVSSWGGGAPASAPITILAQATRIDRIQLHAGDHTALLLGAGLGGVRAVSLAGQRWGAAAPQGDTANDRLVLTAPSDRVAEWSAGRRLIANITLDDGSIQALPVVVLPARPQFSLLARSLKPAPSIPGDLPIALTSQTDIPSGQTLNFSLEVAAGQSLAPDARLEVATEDGAFSTVLTPGAGLARVDSHVAVAALDTAKAFGGAAFGPLRVRLSENGGESDWRPLGNLVRLPRISSVKCGAPDGAPCLLDGDDLFLIAAIGARPDLEGAIAAPDGFPGDALPAPEPRAGRLYLKLRDDPSAPAAVEVGVRHHGASHRAAAHGAATPPPASAPGPVAASSAPAAAPTPAPTPATVAPKR